MVTFLIYKIHPKVTPVQNKMDWSLGAGIYRLASLPPL